MITIKVGEGRSPSGKILDRNTCWYGYDKSINYDERLDAIEYAKSTNRNIYISRNNKSYEKITAEQLMYL